MKDIHILVVDDEKNICRSMQLILTSEGYTVSLAEDGKTAFEKINKNVPDIVFLDVLLPDLDGLTLLPQIKEKYPSVEVIMISGHANLSMAVEATRAGAYNFLEKPLQKEKVLLEIQHLIEKRNLLDRFQTLSREKADEYRMIGESKAIKDIKEQINRIAPTDSKVLIRGESGSGKELVAWAIHYLSQRKNGPFVKMNCAAIPEELTESELFGYEKGAFTGAAETRDGKFLFADGGTLFLDEIADMSIAVQTKVLRVLQDGQFERVGGKETLSVDVRVIAATNKNLEEMVKQKFFREDLYYRLNVLPLYIPPLRERKTDIPLLVTHFMEKYCFKNNHKQVLIDKEVMNILKDYPWPGNIRELQNLMERLIIMSSGDTIKLQDLPPHILKKESEVADIQPGTKSLKEVRESAEREYIRTCLNYCNENVSETADLLKIERTNLHKKMRALGIRKGK